MTPGGRSTREIDSSKRCGRWAWRSKAPNACSVRPATPWSAGMWRPRRGSGSRRTIDWRATCPSSSRRRCERRGASFGPQAPGERSGQANRDPEGGQRVRQAGELGRSPAAAANVLQGNRTNRVTARSRDSDDFHLPLEDPEFLLLDRGGSDRNDQRVAALGHGIEQPSDELEDGVERVVGYQVLDPVNQDRAARLLRHEVLELVHDALQGGRNRLLRRPLAIRQPEDLLRREVVRLADALRIRARADEPAAATREERRESPVSFRRSILLHPVAPTRMESLEARRLARLRLHRRGRRRCRDGFGQDVPHEFLRY